MEENITLRFRGAEKGDIPYIKACGLNAWYAVFHRTDDFSAEAFWDNSERAFQERHDNIQIAMDGDIKAGILIIAPYNKREPFGEHISLLYLEPPYRGQRLGWKFLNKAEELAKERGRKSISLYVASSNKRAIKLYTDYGFKCDDQLRIFRRQLTMKYIIPE